MAAELPRALSAAIATLMQGRSRKDLSERSGKISRRYRAGGSSTGVVEDEADAMAYAVARMPATFAAASEVFERLLERCPDFSPARALDLGAGPGTASWAIAELWPDIAEIIQVDRNKAFLDLARVLAADAESPALQAPRQLAADLVGWTGPAEPFDLMVLGYALTELPPARLSELIARLWSRCTGALVIVEPGTPAGYTRILAMRDRLIGEGARILAPCPHEAPCPLTPPDWCHFAVRLQRSRDHMSAKSATLPYEDEKFAYLVAVRPELDALPAAGRLLDRPEASKIGVAVKLCGTDGALHVRTVPKRDREAFARARKLKWGDLLDLPRR
jgi:ribosomal protein RSM22 (predicted rRNA methylase)